MAKSKPLYVDANGVKRGYYVYLHRQTSSGLVFYVGKGHGRRAWEKIRRHKTWLEKVSSLGTDWEVVIHQDDLSEIEAFAAEEELIVQFGGDALDGGSLINRCPGGENPMTAAIVVELSGALRCRFEAYAAARKFKELSRADQEAFVRRLTADLRPTLHTIEQLEEKGPSEKLADSISDLECIIASLINAGADFLKRRISWQDFALALEDTVGELQPEDIVELHRSLRVLARQGADVVSSALRQIDSGNRAEAEAASKRAAE